MEFKSEINAAKIAETTTVHCKLKETNNYS